MDSDMQGGPVDELLDVAVERRVLGNASKPMAPRTAAASRPRNGSVRERRFDSSWTPMLSPPGRV